MKIGSLVLCIRNDFNGIFRSNEIKPELNKIYTIREIFEETNEFFITLEEITNQRIYRFKGSLVEAAFDMMAFQELLPPMNIEEEIEKSLEINILN